MPYLNKINSKTTFENKEKRQDNFWTRKETNIGLMGRRIIIDMKVVIVKIGTTQCLVWKQRGAGEIYLK